MVVLYTVKSDVYILHGDPKKWSGKEHLEGDVYCHHSPSLSILVRKREDVERMEGVDMQAMAYLSEKHPQARRLNI